MRIEEQSTICRWHIVGAWSLEDPPASDRVHCSAGRTTILRLPRKLRLENFTGHGSLQQLGGQQMDVDLGATRTGTSNAMGVSPAITWSTGSLFLF